MTYKILVADDDLDCRVLIKEAVAGEDCEVITAETGQEALEKATSEDFDLVVIDLHMPCIDGIEALKIIHMSEPDLPIMVVTGVENEELKAEALKNGANLIIEKPFDITSLVEEIKKLLGMQDYE